MDFRFGGSTINGVATPGEFGWSRLYIANGEFHFDTGLNTALALPAEETERRWEATNPEWPINQAVLHGATRDQFIARHKANHFQVAHTPDAESADHARPPRSDRARRRRRRDLGDQ
ncbi:MAG: hypothetical protein LH624_04375 [Cryobacterium sp.]|uniref:hypothetical protein n=1 Tax=Cryobacterium sp. CAN_C3 TaxID=3071721 RepID=UPI00228E5036|nr:hypothetical protein [Cryobacterium sp.]MEC5154289.1 hypothetical protein [Cryobacterium sp. CAN_C3]